ncbi:MAG: hypothetical protein RLZZ175_187 [Bacteroidota bacterium]|jgi:gliding motility-associated-like protein
MEKSPTIGKLEPVCINLYKNKNFASVIIYLSFLFFFLIANHKVHAEGTKEIRPLATDSGCIAFYDYNLNGYGTAFARYNCPNNLRLNFRICNIGEKVFFGLAKDANAVISFRIKAPDGSIVVPAQTVPTTGAGYIASHAQAIAGPSQIVGASGYNAMTFTPTQTGDYYIEFDVTNPSTTAQRITLFDITITNAYNVVIKGRLWSYAWLFSTNASTARFEGAFFIYTNDQIVTRLDLNGMKPFLFTVCANSYGAQNTGNPATDRKSIQGTFSKGISLYPSEYQIFLNDPDINCFPTGTFGKLNNPVITVTGCPGNYTLNMDVDKKGEALVTFDLNGVAGYQSGTTDLVLTYNLVAGLNKLAWNGFDGLGGKFDPSKTFNIQVDYKNGITHFPVFDAELNDLGLMVTSVRPTTSKPIEMFWDDVNITNGVSNSTGCTGACHQWSNSNYGNDNTINTWWYAEKISTTATFVPNPFTVDANKVSPLTGSANDTTFCDYINSLPLKGAFSGDGTVLWTSKTGGTFGSNTSLNTTYNFTNTEKINGKAEVLLSTISNISGCASVKDSMTINIKQRFITVTAPKSISLCGAFNLKVGFRAKVSGLNAGVNVSYQWQVKASGAVSFSNVSNGASYSGVNTDSLTLLGAAIVASGSQYRVLIKSTTSNACIDTVSSIANYNYTTVVTFANGSYSSLESAPTNKPVLIIKGNVANSSTVTLSLTSAAAISGTDYTITSLTVNIPAGIYDGTVNTGVALPLNIVNDAIPESTEYLSFKITGATGDLTISNASCSLGLIDAVYTIYDDDCNKPNLGPDKLYCEGATINQTLVGPSGNEFYEWNTGALTQNITVTTPGTYILKTGKYGQNLIANGDFESGNIGFITGYTYTPGSFPSGGGLYDIVNIGSANSGWAAQFNDHTTGSGKYMFIDGNNVVGVKVWQQNITVTPNTNYVFSAWVRNVSPAGSISPVLNFDINGTNIGGLITVPQDPDPKARQWNQIYATWNSGSNTNITISIEDNVPNAAYNDFAIDDIYFSPEDCIYSDTIVITQPLNPVLTQPQNQVLCNNDNTTKVTFSTVATGTVSYAWTNSLTSIGLAANGTTDNIASFKVVNTTSAPVVSTISVTPTANGCPGTAKSFTITVNPTPFITQPTDTVICNNASVLAKTFNSNVIGSTYTWINDNTSIGLGATGNGSIASFTATNSGSTQTVANITVKPTALTCEGVSKSFKIIVNPTPILTQPTDTVICNNASVFSKTFNSNVTGSTFAWTNDNSSIGLGVSGNGNIASFTGTNSGSTQTVANITVKPTASTCDGVSKTFKISVNPTPILTQPTDTVICNNASVLAKTFNSNVKGSIYTWTNDNTTIGLGASGNGSIASFVATNSTNKQLIATISVKPTASTCDGVSKAFKITVNPTPIVTIPSSFPICNGASTLATSFTSSVTDTITTYSWTNDNTNTGLNSTSGVGNIASFIATNTGNTQLKSIITVTPTAFGACAGTPKAYTITINPTPVISVPSDYQICNGATTTSTNFSSSVVDTINSYKWTNTNTSIGLSASGSGSINSFNVVNNTNSQTFATISVTPYAFGGCEGLPKSFKITVNPTPVLTQPVNQTLCNKANTNNVVFTSSVIDTVNTYKWTNSNINSGLSLANGTGDINSFIALNNGFKKDSSVITVTPYAHGGCVGQSKSFKIYINPTPDVIQPANQTICNNAKSSLVNFASNVLGTTFSWTNDQPTIGISNTGNGNISSFTAINISNAPIVANIKVLPTANSCVGTDKSFTFTINPSPDVNAKNDTICSSTSTNIPLTSSFSGTTFAWTNPLMTNVTGATSGNGNTISQLLNNVSLIEGTVDYSITPTLNSCNGSPKTVRVTVIARPAFTGKLTDTLCTGTPILKNLTTNIGSAKVAWVRNVNAQIQESANSGTSNSIAETLNINPYITSEVNVVYNLTTTSSIKSCAGTPAQYVVSLVPRPQVISKSTDSICSGSVLNYQTLVNINKASVTWNRASVTGITTSTSSGSTTLIKEGLLNANASNTEVNYVITPKYGTCVGADFNLKVTIFPEPKVNLTGDKTICNGDSALLTFAFEGNKNWNMKYTDGFVINTINNIATNPYSFYVKPTDTKTYQIISLTDVNNCLAKNANLTGMPKVLVNKLPFVSVSGDNTICNGDNSIISFDFHSQSVSPFQITYTENGVSKNITGINTNPYLLDVNPTLNTSYKLVNVRDRNCAGAVDTDSAYVEVANYPNVVVSAIKDTLCSNQQQTFNLKSTVAGTEYGTVFSWKTKVQGPPVTGYQKLGVGSTIILKAINKSSNNSSILYIVEPIFTLNGVSCKGKLDTTKVTIRPELNLDLGIDRIGICPGSELKFKAANFPNNPGYYEWYINGELQSNDTDSLLFKPEFDGNIQGKYIDACGENTDEVNYTLQKLVSPTFTQTDSCANYVIVLTPDKKYDGISYWVWDYKLGGKPDTTLASIANSSKIFTQAGEYKVNLKGFNGTCKLADTLLPVKVKDCNVYFVNTFTPNGDNQNDVWRVKGIENYPDAEIQIFNRWGVKVRYKNGGEVSWDGLNENGEEVEEGVYYYVIHLNRFNGHGVTKGYITLMRNNNQSR